MGQVELLYPRVRAAPASLLLLPSGLLSATLGPVEAWPYGPLCPIGIPVCERSSLQLRLRVSNGSLSLTTGDSRLI